MNNKRAFLELTRESLKHAILHAVSTIHNQAGASTIEWFKRMFPQGEIEELDLAVRVRSHFFTKKISIEFKVNRVKGYTVLNSNTKLEGYIPKS